MWCPCGPPGEAIGSLCRSLFGKIALWGAAAGCTGKIAYRPMVREFGPERPPTARQKPNLLVYHISVNLSMSKIKKIKKKKRTSVLFIFAGGGPVGVCDTGPINPAITFSAFHSSSSSPNTKGRSSPNPSNSTISYS